MKNFSTILSVFLVLTVVGACASELERELTDNAPYALEEAVDLSQVNFRDVQSGEVVNVAEYMDATQKEFLLLTFGSKGCVSCDAKAVKFENEIIGKHPLYLTSAKDRFEIIGVNTDPLKGRAIYSYLREFKHIRWSDARGETMLKFFMPAGVHFSVPLTVMIAREGIVWRIPPTESVSVSDIMDRISGTLGNGNTDTTDQTDGDGSDDSSDADGSDGSGTGDDGAATGGDTGGDDGSVIPVEPTDLTYIGPGRLKKLVGKSCDNEEINIDDQFQASDSENQIKFVFVKRNQCEGLCADNMNALDRVVASCQLDSSVDCGVVKLSTADLTEQDCTNQFLKGGEEFYSVFDTHFFRHPVEIDWDWFIPDLADGIVIGFDESGEIVYSNDGTVAIDSTKLLASIRNSDQAKGLRFELFDNQSKSFHSIRNAEYTVLSILALDPVCPPCIDELRHWSEPGGLVDICLANPTKCEVLALEDSQVHGSSTEQLRSWRDYILNDMPDPGDPDRKIWDGIRIPLYLDPVPMDDEIRRYFAGYIRTLQYGNGIRGPRTVIYNGDGRLIQTYGVPVEGEPDHVTPFIKDALGLD